MTDLTKEIIHPILRTLEGHSAPEIMSCLAAVTACVVHQAMMPGVADRDTFNAAMATFSRQVQENLVMLIEEHKGR